MLSVNVRRARASLFSGELLGLPRLADDIRSFVRQRYVTPARHREKKSFRLRAGDVHEAMGLHSRLPAVCSALQSADFLRRNGLKLVDRRGPRQGSNVFLTFEFITKDTLNADAAFTEPETIWEARTDWFWEGNIQNRIAEFLRCSGYNILKIADTSIKEQGPDILAEKGGRRCVISVKGYPSQRYASDSLGGKKGDIKRTTPSTQARHWLRDAVFDCLLAKSDNPNSEVALGLPDFTTYRRMVDRISWARIQLGISCYLVNKEAHITVLAPDQRP